VAINAQLKIVTTAMIFQVGMARSCKGTKELNSPSTSVFV
jgi:hypothetical protein